MTSPDVVISGAEWLGKHRPASYDLFPKTAPLLIYERKIGRMSRSEVDRKEWRQWMIIAIAAAVGATIGFFFGLRGGR
jgi:hypothetical protein